MDPSQLAVDTDHPGKRVWIRSRDGDRVASEAALVAILEKQDWLIRDLSRLSRRELMAAPMVAGTVPALARLVGTGLPSGLPLFAVAHLELHLDMLDQTLRPAFPKTRLLRTPALQCSVDGETQFYWASLGPLIRRLRSERLLPLPVLMQKGWHKSSHLINRIMRAFEVDSLVQFGFGSGRVFGELDYGTRTVVDPAVHYDVGVFDHEGTRVFEMPGELFCTASERARAGLYVFAEVSEEARLLSLVRATLRPSRADSIWYIAPMAPPSLVRLRQCFPQLNAVRIGTEAFAATLLWQQARLGDDRSDMLAPVDGTGATSHPLFPRLVSLEDGLKLAKQGQMRARAQSVRAIEDRRSHEVGR